ncbi:aminopeptidase P family protein [Microbacterium excoecariae]|uniref:aminopeptidase P family protein n=1 Tax=Microbacterium excoecariae TaxID=2715210 RepID=UPI00140E262D|nr:aminopeptidase P family protein [Microbacterium excoecariae]NHI15668.1 aminopeptidase P family protein [Microbacterium excoecariae]
MTNLPRPPYAGTRYPRLAEVDAFRDWIAGGWADEPVAPDLAAGAAAAAAEHRARLGERLPDATIVAAAGVAPVRNDDASYGFRADSAFVWLTNCQAEDAVLVMTPRAGGHDAVLFLPAPFRPGETGFFANALHGELWVGPTAGLGAWAEALGIEVRPLAEFDADRLGGAHFSAAAARRFGVPASAELERAVSVLRMVKDPWEIAQLRQAVDASVAGFAATVAEVPRAIEEGLGERWLQGTFDRHARTLGNGPGYSTIVGSGPHAPTLHWVRCDGPVLPDALLLLDMGVEARTLYTADVTRTFPASGSFSPVQRDVHDLVEKAHRAGLAQIRPGTAYLDFHFAAMEVIATGLHDWGLLPVSVDEALSPQGQHHRRYLACGIGHHLGLDVHDCSQAHYEDYMGADLEPGVVMTVEPGLYFHAHDLTLPPELRGIGVRLEDDVLVTETGSEVLSDALPIDAAGVEEFARRQMGAR